METIKKCYFCDRETRRSRNDFGDINWMAMQFGNDKMICACYEHHQEFMKLMEEKIKSNQKLKKEPKED